MNRQCPVTLDKPILMFGLEMEDVALLGAVGGIGSILFGPILPGVISILGWIILMKFKQDKPSGYLIHFLYDQGMSFPGLIPPIKKSPIYGIYGSADQSKKIPLY